jgi:FkbM family methyltransferase
MLGVKRLSGHTFFLRTIPKSPSVLDCGAHKGDFQTALSHSGITFRKLVCVEANPSLALRLQSILPTESIIQNAALVGRDEQKTVPFTISMNPEASSIYSEVANSFGKATVTNVPCVTLSNLLALFDNQSVDILKCDIEGAEIDVFQHLESGTLARIHQLNVEFHDNFSPSMSKDVKKTRLKLINHGFLELNANWPYTDDILYVNNHAECKLRVAHRTQLTILRAMYVFRGCVFLLLKNLGLKK